MKKSRYSASSSRKKMVTALVGFSACAVAACTPYSQSNAALGNGSLSIVRSAPPVVSQSIANAKAAAPAASMLFGFAPLPAEFVKAIVAPVVQPVLLIDTSSEQHKLALADSSTYQLTDWHNLPSDHAVAIPPGTYRILHRERDPLWYANDDFFITRSLPIPPTYGAERFQAGAYGKFALFLSPTVAIHCGPETVNEVKGIRLPCDTLSRIFAAVRLQSLVVVR